MPSDPDQRPAPIVRREAGPLVQQTPLDAQGLALLPRLDLEDYVPSVRPWLRISTVAVLISSVLGVLFMAICPYRVIVRGNGFVRPAGEQILVNAPFDGRVVSIDVRLNQSVQAGQPIVTLDRSRLRGELEQTDKSRLAWIQQMQAARSQAKAEYERAELEVEKVRSSLAFAQSEFARYQQLAKEGAASASFFEGKRAELQAARASMAQAIKGLETTRSQARTREAELQKELATLLRSSQEGQRNLSNAVVRAPVKGIVFQLQVQNPQQTIASGQSLATITPSSVERLVKVEVRGEDVDQVRTGQRAELRIAGCPYPDYGTVAARVISVSPDALPMRQGQEGTEGPTQASDLFEVTLKPSRIFLKSRSQRCEVKLGMRLQADIITRQETILRFVLRKTRMLVGQ